MNRTRALIALAACAVLLGGCGSARVGVAAQVGDQSFTTTDVDRLASSYCDFYERQLTGQNAAVPMELAKASVVGALSMRAAADQLADEYDVSAGESYEQARANLEQTTEAAGASESAAEAVVIVDSTSDYVTAVLQEVGRVSLAEEGTEDASSDDALARGQDILTTWVAQHQPEIDPRYGLELTGTQPERVDTTTSFPLSAFAQSALPANQESQEDVTSFARSLPESQRCG